MWCGPCTLLRVDEIVRICCLNKSRIDRHQGFAHFFLLKMQGELDLFPLAGSFRVIIPGGASEIDIALSAILSTYGKM